MDSVNQKLVINLILLLITYGNIGQDRQLVGSILGSDSLFFMILVILRFLTNKSMGINIDSFSKNMHRFSNLKFYRSK